MRTNGKRVWAAKAHVGRRANPPADVGDRGAAARRADD
jgi:hypothetical protein